MEKVSAIICVFNEERTLRNVILSAVQNQYIDEVIVVNDGSTDSSRTIIDSLHDELDFKSIMLVRNMGKGYAMAVGVENAKNEILFFIDADQVKIPQNYIGKMLTIFSHETCGMVLGYSTVKIEFFDVNPLKILTGERVVLKKDIVQILNKMKESRFGVETLMYLHFKSLDKKIRYTRLKGLKHNDKFKKTTVTNATKRYLQETWEICLSAVKNYDLIFKIFIITIRNKPDHDNIISGSSN
jgi:glycosyltransferase involved in cell wall biosynthesis